ncbi:MAG: hypothetical protein AAF567_14455 [Actinomycetota bacterium]
MVMLGATLEELVALGGRLDAATGEISEVGAQTQTIAGSVVAEMQGAFAVAVAGITDAMAALRTTVETSRATLDATTWTGANRQIFDGAHLDFAAAMTQLEASVADAYGQFDAQMHQVGEMIETFQVQVMAGLDQAQQSTTSMARAVDAQRENLDLAMNSGLGVG